MKNKGLEENKLIKSLYDAMKAKDVDEGSIAITTTIDGKRYKITVSIEEL